MGVIVVSEQLNMNQRLDVPSLEGVPQWEKADTALIGLATQLFDTGKADHVVLLKTDKPAG